MESTSKIVSLILEKYSNPYPLKMYKDFFSPFSEELFEKPLARIKAYGFILLFTSPGKITKTLHILPYESLHFFYKILATLMRKLCNFSTFISPHSSTLFHHALTFCHLMYCILFCVFVYCICILPTDMHCIEYNGICWQLQLVEKLSTHIFVLAIEIKSVFLCLSFPSWCIFVCILIWMRLKIA